MRPGGAVASVIGGYKGLLLTSIKFALAWVDGVCILRFSSFVGDDGVIGIHDGISTHSIPYWTVETYTCETS